MKGSIRRTRNILLAIFVEAVVGTLAIVAVFELELLPRMGMAGQPIVEFVWTTVMELLTLAGVYLALRLFKFRKVSQELSERKAEALQKWGVIRLTMIEAPMFANTLSYYLLGSVTFGYLAIIGLICLPFIYPSMGRCLSETSSELEEK